MSVSVYTQKIMDHNGPLTTTICALYDQEDLPGVKDMIQDLEARMLPEPNMANGNAFAVFQALGLNLEELGWCGSMPAGELAGRCLQALNSPSVGLSEGVASSDTQEAGRCRVIAIGRAPEYLDSRIRELFSLASSGEPGELVYFG